MPIEKQTLADQLLTIINQADEYTTKELIDIINAFILVNCK